MPRRLSPAEQEIQDYIDSAQQGLAGQSPKAQTMARSRDPRTAYMGERMMQDRASDNARNTDALGRQIVRDAKAQEAEAKRQAAAAERAARETEARNVRAGRAQGMVTETNVETGRTAIKTDATGQPVWRSGPVGKPYKAGTSTSETAVGDYRPLSNPLIADDGGAASAPGTATKAVTENWMQDRRVPAGNITPTPLEVTTDKETGNQTIQRKDATGQPIETRVGVDPAIREKQRKAEAMKQRKANLDLARNQLDQTFAAYQPQFEPVEQAYKEAQAAWKPFTEDGIERRQIGSMSKWGKIGETGIWRPISDQDAAAYNARKAEAQKRLAIAEQAYNQAKPRMEGLTREKARLDFEKLRIEEDEIRSRAGLEERDHIAELFAANPGGVGMDDFSKAAFKQLGIPEPSKEQVKQFQESMANDGSNPLTRKLAAMDIEANRIQRQLTTGAITPEEADTKTRLLAEWKGQTVEQAKAQAAAELEATGREIAGQFIGTGVRAQELANGQPGNYAGIKNEISEMLNFATGSENRTDKTAEILRLSGGNLDRAIEMADGQTAYRIMEMRDAMDRAGIKPEDRKRIITDAAKSQAWTERDKDTLRQLSTGDLVINPGKIFGDKNALIAEINATKASPQAKRSALSRLDAMRKAMAEEVDATLYYADSDASPVSRTVKGLATLGINEMRDGYREFVKKKNAAGVWDKEAILDAYMADERNRGKLFKLGNVIEAGLTTGSAGIYKTGVGVLAQSAAITDQVTGFDSNAGGSLAKHQMAVGQAIQGIDDAAKQRGITGGWGIGKDFVNTVTQMAPMLVGGAATKGMQGLGAFVTRNMAVGGWAAAQGWESATSQAIEYKEKQKGSPLTAKEASMTLQDPKVIAASFGNAFQTAALTYLVKGGPDKMALGAKGVVPAAMTVRDFLGKGGIRVLRDGTFRKEIVQLGRNLKGDAVGEFYEESANQALETFIVSLGAGKDISLGDAVEEWIKAGGMGLLAGGAVPQLYRGQTKADQHKAMLSELQRQSISTPDGKMVSAALRTIDPEAQAPDAAELTKARQLVAAPTDGAKTVEKLAAAHEAAMKSKDYTGAAKIEQEINKAFTEAQTANAKDTADAVLLARELDTLEEQAGSAVRDAQQALNAARATGDKQAVSAAEVNVKQVRQQSPNAPLARAAVKIATGMPATSLIDKEQRALGIAVDKTGKITLRTDKELTEQGLTKPLAIEAADGSLVILDEAVQQVAATSERAAARIKLGEQEAMQAAQARAAAATPSPTPATNGQNTQGTPGQEAAAETPPPAPANQNPQGGTVRDGAGQTDPADGAGTETKTEIADQLSKNLPARSTETVEPRPERNGRDRSARDAWDEKFGMDRKGGRSHNDDGTPYQPTVFDEVGRQVMQARASMTDEQATLAIGDSYEASIATSLRRLLNAGWVWDAQQNRMVDPKNPSARPVDFLAGKETNAQQEIIESDPFDGTDEDAESLQREIEAEAVADEVVSRVIAKLPGMKGRITVQNERPTQDGREIETGGLHAVGREVVLTIPDIMREIEKAKGDAEAVADSIERMALTHEIVHLIQFEAVQDAWKESGGKGTWAEFFNETYGRMAGELGAEVMAEARKIYGNAAWDALTDAQRAAEVVRMLVESRMNPDAPDVSELFRAVRTANSPTFIDLLKRAVEKLVAMLNSGELPQDVREEVDKIEALYRELTGETSAGTQTPPELPQAADSKPKEETPQTAIQWMFALRSGKYESSNEWAKAVPPAMAKEIIDIAREELDYLDKQMLPNDGRKMSKEQIDLLNQRRPYQSVITALVYEHGEAIHKLREAEAKPKAKDTKADKPQGNEVAGWQTRNADLGEKFKAAKRQVDEIEARIDEQRRKDSKTLPPGYNTYPAAMAEGMVVLEDSDGNDIRYPITPEEAATEAWSLHGGNQYAETQKLEKRLAKPLEQARAAMKAASEAWNANGKNPMAETLKAEAEAQQAAEEKKQQAVNKARKTREETKAKPSGEKPESTTGPERPDSENWPLEAGVYEDDGLNLKVIRDRVRSRIQEKKPIYPNRALGLQYAVVNTDVPRGLPIAQVALANLKVGESFPLNGKTYTVEQIGKTIRFSVSDGTKKTLNIDTEKAEQFLRDVDGLLMGVPHGLDAGDLVAAWERDPASTRIPRRPSITRPMGTQQAPAPSNLSEGDKKALKVLEGLFSSPAQDTYTTPIPTDRMAALIDAAATWMSEGVNTPEALAAKLDALAPEGKARKFSQALWGAMKSVGADGAWEPDWADVYQKQEKPNTSQERVAEENASTDLDANETEVDAPQAEAAAPSEKASTQINLPEKLADRIRAFAAKIPDSELYTAEDGYGREDEVHVTVLYGLTSDTAEQAAKALQGFGPIEYKLGKLSLFENEKYDVLKIDVISPDLHRANKALRDSVDFENDYPDYKPHVTIAYLKKGEGAKYAGKPVFGGAKATSEEVLYSGKDRSKTPISLAKEAPPQDTAEPANPPQEAPTKQRKPRTIDSPARREAFALIREGETEYQVLSKLIGSVGKIAPPPANFGLIRSKRRKKQKLTRTEQAQWDKFDGQYNGVLFKNELPDTPAGKVARELLGMVMGRQGEGLDPDKAAQGINRDWTPDQLWTAIRAELGKIAKGRVESPLDPNRQSEPTPEEIAAAEAQNASAAASAETQQEQDQRFDAANTPANGQPMAIEDFRPDMEGQYVTVDGERMFITSVEWNSFLGVADSVVLDDHTRFGRQVLEDGEVVYVEEDPGESPEAAPKKPAQQSAMDRKNADSRELFADDGGFKLGQESTQDGDKIAAERKAKEEAKAAMDAAQGDMFGEAQTPAPEQQEETPEQQEAETATETPSLYTKPVTDLDSLIEHVNAMVKGETTAEAIRSAWAWFKDNKAQIHGQLGKLTMKQLERFQGMRRPDNKSDAVRSALHNLLTMFNPINSYSINPMGGNLTDKIIAAMDAKISQWTDEMLAETRKNRAERIADEQRARSNPETKDEWEAFVYRAGRQALTPDEVKEILKIKSGSGRMAAVIAKGEQVITPEQLAAFDAIRGIDRKADAQREAERKAMVRGVKADTSTEIIETKHTKTGEPLFVVQLAERVERETYNQLNAAAKRLGGWYSSYRAGGAVPGFQFKTRENAEQFQAVSKGETVDRSEQLAEKKEARKSAAADKLRAVADRMDEAADKVLNADRKTNTAKRAREAGYAEANANSIKAMAQTMRNLSDAIESGEATHLDGVTARTHVETLDSLAKAAKRDAERDEGLSYGQQEDRKYENPTPEQMAAARYPWPYLDTSSLNEMIERGRTTPGAKLLAERAAKIRLDDPRQTQNGGYINNSSDIETVRELAQKTRDYKGKPAWDGIKWKFDSYDRLQTMGLKDLPSLRAALREFTQYRGKRAKADPVKAMERELVEMKIEGFFPTPPAVIERMLEEAGDLEGKRVLEPSAGKGDIVEAAQRAGATVDAIEQQYSLRNILEAKGANLIGSDFMDVTPNAEYDVVMMNPPFENGQDAEHVMRAFDFLKPGGKLVAITGEGIFSRNDAKAKSFRDWLYSEGGTAEKLPEGSFKSSFRPTGVNTRLVVIEKPVALYSSPRRDTGTPDLFAAANAPDAKEKLGDVKAGKIHALNAYRTLTAKKAKVGLSQKEEQQLLEVEQALGQKLAFDMESVRGGATGKQPLQVQPTPAPQMRGAMGGQQDMMLGGETLKGGQMTLFASPSSDGRLQPPPNTPAIMTTDGRMLAGPALFASPAWHGTPHKVDRFRLDKIGTGEGAQAYGWGLYFAENKGVAGSYTTAGSMEANAAKVIRGKEPAKDLFGRELPKDESDKKWAKEYAKAIKGDWKKILRFLEGETGNLYRVELDVEPEDLLDWDKPLREQSEKVRKALAELPEATGDTGAEIYRSLSRPDALWENRGLDMAEIASRLLANVGISGIRYLDGNSRSNQFSVRGAGNYHSVINSTNGQKTDEFEGPDSYDRATAKAAELNAKGSYNYVIFDEDVIRITEENGKPVSPQPLFSSPSQQPFDKSAKLSESLLSAFPKTPDQYQYEPVTITDPAIRRALEPEGSYAVSSGELRDYARSFQERTGAEVVFYAGTRDQTQGQRGAAGFTNLAAQGKIFVNSAIDYANVANTLAHELIHLAQRDGTFDHSEVTRIILNNTSDSEILNLAKILVETGYAGPDGEGPILHEIEAFLVADAVTGTNFLRLNQLKESAKIKAELIRFFDSIPVIKPGTESVNPGGEFFSMPVKWPSNLYAHTYEKETSRGETKHVVKTFNERTGLPERRVFDTYAEAKQEMERLDDLASPADFSLTLGSSPSGKRRSDPILDEIKKLVTDPEKKAETFGRMNNLVAEVRRRFDSGRLKREMSKQGIDSARYLQLRDVAVLEAVARALPPEMRGKLIGSFRRLNELKSERGREQYILKLLPKIEQALEKHLRKLYRQEIRKIIDKGQPQTNENRNRRGKIGAVGHAIIDAATDAMTKPVAVALTEAAALRDVIETEQDANGNAVPMDIETMEEYEGKAMALELFSDYDNADSKRLESALEFLEGFYTESRRQWLEVLEARKAKREEEIEELRKAIKAPEFITDAMLALARDRSEKPLTYAGNAVLDAISSAYDLFDRLKERTTDPKSIAWVDAQQKKLRDARGAYDDAVEAERVALEETMERIFRTRTGWIGKFDLDPILHRLSERRDDHGITVLQGKSHDPIHVPIKKGNIDIAERIYRGEADTYTHGNTTYKITDMDMPAFREAYERYLELPEKAQSKRRVIEFTRVNSDGFRVPMGRISQLEALKEWLAMRQPDFFEKYEGQGWDETTFAELESWLKPEAKELGLWMVERMREQQKDLDTKHREEFGIGMKLVENYFPGLFEGKGDDNSEIPLEGMDAGIRAKSPSSLKTRVVHRARPRRMNAVSMFLSNRAQTHFFMTHATPMRELLQVMRAKPAREAIRVQIGESYARSMVRQLKTIETNGVTSSDGVLDAERIIRKMTSGYALATLGLKLSTLAINTTAALNTLLGVPVGTLAKGLSAEYFGDVKRFFNTPAIMRRLKHGTSHEVRIASQGGIGSTPLAAGGRRIAQTNMQAINWWDTFSNSVLGALAYRAALEEARKAGLPEAEAVKRAEETIDRLSTTVMQPNNLLSRSGIEIKLTSTPIGQLLFMFATEQRKNAALAVYAWRKLLTNKGSVSRGMALQQLVVLHAFYGGLSYAIRSAYQAIFKGDDDEPEDWMERLAKRLTDQKAWFHALATEHLKGIPLLGEAWNHLSADLINLFPGEDVKVFDSSQNILNRAGKGAMKVGKVFDEDATPEEQAQAIIDAIQGLAGMSSETAAIAQIGNVAEDSLGFLVSNGMTLSRAERFKRMKGRFGAFAREWTEKNGTVGDDPMKKALRDEQMAQYLIGQMATLEPKDRQAYLETLQGRVNQDVQEMVSP